MKTHRYSLLSLLFILLLIFSACSSSSSNETESSQAESRLRYRMAFHIADDGWVYVFANQYIFGDFDYSSQNNSRYPFSFRGINLRYRYDEGYTESFEDTDSNGNKVTKTVLQSTLILGYSDSQSERHDMDKIAEYLGYKREGSHLTTSELLALTAEDLNFEYIDAEMFLDLMHECLTSESDPHGGYTGIPSWALFTEPQYIDNYKFQIGLIGGFGRVEVLMFDVLYRTGDGLTDYVQLYDLVKNGEASEEQIQLLNALQEIERGIVENNDLQFKRDEFEDEVIDDVAFSRLYVMLKNIMELNYGQYVVSPQ